MAKQGGMGQGLYVGGYDLSGDIQKLDEVGGGSNLLDFTDITQYARAREFGLRDGRLSTTVYFDPASNRSHPRLSTLPATDVHLMWVMNPSIGGDAFTMVAKQVNYDGTRGDDGSYLFKVDGLANGYGGEFTYLLTAGTRTDTGAANGSSLDTGASASFGAQAFLQVFAFSGTDATITIEDSANDSTFAAVTGLAFTQVTAGHVTERLATSNTATIRRYLRVATTTSAGFTSLAFAVGINKNTTAGVAF